MINRFQVGDYVESREYGLVEVKSLSMEDERMAGMDESVPQH